jgi:hypothetical protein
MITTNITSEYLMEIARYNATMANATEGEESERYNKGQHIACFANSLLASQDHGKSSADWDNLTTLKISDALGYDHPDAHK